MAILFRKKIRMVLLCRAIICVFHPVKGRSRFDIKDSVASVCNHDEYYSLRCDAL